MGRRASRQLALKFGDADAFAFCAGRRNRISVVDVDSPDERLLQRCLNRYGPTPLIVRTGGGKFHLYYRNGDEPRRIRPRANEPVDILGSGVVVAPPSRGSGRAYEIIQGSLEDIARLPVMRRPEDLEQAETVARALPARRIPAGNRSKALIQYLRPRAHFCDTKEDLADEAFTWVEQHLDREGGHPFTDADVWKAIDWVWGITERGENVRPGGEGYVQVGRRVVLDLAMANPDAFALLARLKATRFTKKAFSVPNDMANDVGWTRKRFATARRALIEAGQIEELQPASSYHGPALYRFRDEGGRE